MTTEPDHGKLIVCFKMGLHLGYYVLYWVTLADVVFGLDPLYQVFRVGPIFGRRNFVLFLFRGVVTLGFTNAFLLASSATSLFGTMVVCSTTDFIRRSTQRRGWEMFEFYRQLQIWNGYLNGNFCYFAAPPVIFFGLSFIVLGTYGSIRMIGRMPWMFYPAVLVSTAVGIVVGVLLARYGAVVFESSEEYLLQLRHSVRSKQGKRLVQSLRPLVIAIGPFGRVDNGLCTQLVRYFVECTGNLLITF